MQNSFTYAIILCVFIYIYIVIFNLFYIRSISMSNINTADSSQNPQSPMSLSLLNNNVYCVCFTERESYDVFKNELTSLRKDFFTQNKKTTKINEKTVVKGFSGKVKGKISKRNLSWKKTASEIVIEESLSVKGGFLIIQRDFSGLVSSKIFFDKSQTWLKSEYYSPENDMLADVILKAADTFDGIERFDYDSAMQKYTSVMLYPAPYAPGTAEQSIVNAKYGEPSVVVESAKGIFSYTTEDDANLRKSAITDMNDGTIVLMPAWEVKAGEISSDSDDDEEIAFTSLEEYARITPDTPATESDVPVPEAPMPEVLADLSIDSEYSSPENEIEVAEEYKEVSDDSSDNFDNISAQNKTISNDKNSDTSKNTSLDQEELDILSAAKRMAGIEDADIQPNMENEKSSENAVRIVNGQAETTNSLETSNKTNDNTGDTKQISSEDVDIINIEDAETAGKIAGYRGAVVDGQLSGRGRTEQKNGLTAYDGEYVDGKREGFGSYYYKNGKLCYAGSWKNDQKDGLGVSFRNSDGALHIAKWEENTPGGFVSLFDKDGNLRYGGRIEDGKKQGVGVSYSSGDGTVFIGKWKDGEHTGYGSMFDDDGNLLYTGQWKDGKRDGTGTEFDFNGEIIFSGEWKDGKQYNGILYKKFEDSASENHLESEN